MLVSLDLLVCCSLCLSTSVKVLTLKEGLFLINVRRGSRWASLSTGTDVAEESQ